MKAVFLCESCRNVVSYKAHRCPHCGRYFSAVVCPNCKFTAKPKDFLDGCPRCGYLSKELEKNDQGFILSKDKKPSFELPIWFYKVAGIVIAIILVSIIIWYFTSVF